MTVFDGFTTVKPHFRLRCGHAVIIPVKENATTPTGLVTARQDGLPTGIALVLAVSPFSNGFAPVEAGDIIVRQPYAGEVVDEYQTGLAPMERSARLITIIQLRDIEAIVGHVDIPPDSW